MALTEPEATTTARPMGRPPLGHKPTQVRLPEELKARVIALVGTYGLAKFIREAVEAELERRERKRGES